MRDILFLNFNRQFCFTGELSITRERIATLNSSTLKLISTETRLPSKKDHSNSANSYYSSAYHSHISFQLFGIE